MLPAPLNHPHARARACTHRRFNDGRRRGRKAIGMEPGRTEPATAARNVAAHPDDEQPGIHESACKFLIRQTAGLGAICPDHRSELRPPWKPSWLMIRFGVQAALMNIRLDTRHHGLLQGTDVEFNVVIRTSVASQHLMRSGSVH